MTHQTETEFKLRASQPLELAQVDAAVREAGFTCRATDTRRVVDVYLDDGTAALANAGIGLRLREDRHGPHLACKSPGRRSGALFVREERAAPWPQAALPRTAGELPQTVRDAIEPFVIDRPLQTILRLNMQRESRLLQYEGRDLCELTYDRVEAEADGRTAAFLEVEIEVLDDVPSCERLAESLMEVLPLHAAGDDKPTHASALLGLVRPQHRVPELSTNALSGEVVAAIAERHLDAMQRAEVGVRDDRDPLHLHTMRVAVRRLRGLVRAFRDLWPAEQAAWLLQHLGETGRQLGALRDLDVMMSNLPEAVASLPGGLQAAGEQVASWVRGQRTLTHDVLHGWLRSGQRLADVNQMQRCLRLAAASGERAASPLSEAVPPRLAKCVASVRHLASAMPDDLPTEPLHELRIASKNLRYLAEEFAELPPYDYAKSVAAVTRLQQVLGVVCDHEVAAARLLEWIPAVTRSAGDPMQVAAALGGLAAQHAAAARKGRKAARALLRRVDRKKVWKRFVPPTAPDASLA